MKVGELFATLKLDSKGFDDGLDKSKRSFDGLRSGVSKGTQAFATAFAASTTAVAGLGVAALKVGVSYNSLRQTATSALTTLLGSAEAAADQMDRLDDFGKDSWVMRDVLVQAQTQMLGFGVETEKVIPYLDALQEGVAAVGGSNQDFGELAFIMAQIEGQSKITSEELRMFGRRGIDAAELIGAGMGKTAEQIRSEITAGTLDATDALDAMAASMSEEFAGATENVLKTWDGATSFIAGAWRDLGAELAKPLVDPEGGGYAVDWAMDFSDALYALRDQAGPFVDLMAKRFTPALEAVSPAIQKVVSGIKGWDVSRLNAQLDEMGKYAPLIAGTSAALFAMGSTSLPLIGRFVPAINPLVAGLGAMVAFSPELRALGTDFFEALSPLIPVASELAGLLADSFMGVLHALTPALGDVLAAAADMAVVFGVGLAPAVETLIRAAVPMAEVLGNVVSWFAQLPTPVLTAMTAFMLFKTPVGEAASALTGVFSKALSTVNENLAASRGVIEATGGKITGLGTVAMTARAGVSSLGTALKTAFVSNLPLLAITAITTAVGWWAAENAKTKQSVEEIKDSLDQQTGAITENTRALALKKLQDSDAVGVADALGLSLETVVDAMLGNRDATNEVSQAMGEFEDELLATEQATGHYSEAQLDAQGVVEKFSKTHNRFADHVDKSQEALDRERQAGIKSKDAHNELAGAVDRSTDAVRRGDDAVRALRDSLDEFSGKTLDAREAELRFKDAVDAAKEATKQNTDGLDDNTKAGRDNERKLQDIAREAKEMATRIADSTGSQEKYTGALKAGRDELIKAARNFGMTKDEAKQYADEILKIPTKAETQAHFDDIAARNRIARFKEILAMPTVRVGVDVKRQGYYQDRADGGFDEAGRYVPRVPQMAAGGRNILWQEDESIWESYISGKPSARQRNLEVMDKTARRLGGVFIRPGDLRMADGGTTGPQRTETITSDSGQRPIYITINSVESDHVDETAKALNFALRTRGGLYSRS